jgi:DASS family divalent anion:Na+ symporter
MDDEFLNEQLVPVNMAASPMPLGLAGPLPIGIERVDSEAWDSSFVPQVTYDPRSGSGSDASDYGPPWKRNKAKAKISASLALRVAACCIAAALSVLPQLGVWKAHVVLAIFLFTIVGLVALPEVPGTALVICGLAMLGITGASQDHRFCLEPPDSITSYDKSCSGLWWGFSASVTWLVVNAILISSAVQSSGIGRRIALELLQRLGHSNLGMAYALCAAELILAPVVPSNTARGGGCLSPVIQAVCNQVTLDARPFVVLTAAHANLLSSSMFKTGSSGNQLVADAAKEVSKFPNLPRH